MGLSRILGRIGKGFEVVEWSVGWNLKFLLGRTS